MDVSVRLVDLTLMHPSLLWEDIVAATVAVFGETRSQVPFHFALTVQDVPGFGSDQLRLAVDPIGVTLEYIERLRRTYEPGRLVELAAIAIAGLGTLLWRWA